MESASTWGSPPRRVTTTERNWLLALLLVVAVVLLFAALQWAERSVWGIPAHERLVGDAFETSTRCLAIPHFLLAFLFLATSRSVRCARAWLTIMALCGLGAFLCWAFARTGGAEARLPKTLLALYFVVHAFRDEAYFYVANGDAPAARGVRAARRESLVAPALLFGIVIGILFVGVGFEVGGARRYTAQIFGGLEPWLRRGICLLPLLAVGWGLGVLHRRGWDLVRLHRPMFTVFAGLFVVIVLDFVVNARPTSIIALHVAAWYVFVTHGMSRRPIEPRPGRNAWRWMRATPGGFTFLHAGLVVLIILGAAIWAYAFQNDPSRRLMWLVLSEDAFPYWTIVHITVSFRPRG